MCGVLRHVAPPPLVHLPVDGTRVPAGEGPVQGRKPAPEYKRSRSCKERDDSFGTLIFDPRGSNASGLMR